MSGLKCGQIRFVGKLCPENCSFKQFCNTVRSAFNPPGEGGEVERGEIVGDIWGPVWIKDSDSDGQNMSKHLATQIAMCILLVHYNTA